MNSIAEKIILVTGATGGIGGATARQLSGLGARLVISGRDAGKLADLEKQLDGEVLPVTADATDEAQVEAAYRSAIERYGRLDTLINVPGTSTPAQVAEMDTADFDRLLAVNVKSMFLFSKHFLRQVDPQRGGLIVSISSVAARSANAAAPVYCAAKAALNMLSDGIQLQGKKNNVRTSLVSPGAVSTPGFWADRPVPHEQFLRPEDVADVVAFVVGQPEHVVMHDVVFEPWKFYKNK